MSAPCPYEAELLAHTNEIIEAFARRHKKRPYEARLQLLEAAASRLGGFRLEDFQAQFGIKAIAPLSELLQISAVIVEKIKRLSMHPALALSALSREKLNDSSRRITGAYHTDFRLAVRLAHMAAPKLKQGLKVIDPACGAGILLVALTIEACGPDRRKIARWLAESVYAADLSAVALRGCLLSLASLTSDIQALTAMRSKWIVGDSLLASDNIWSACAPEGFDVVIGNPPWEKVKLTRHEYLKAQGHTRHYGAEVRGINHKAFAREKNGLADYARQLIERYPSLVDGEPDLYIAFTELFERLCKAGGTMAALVPAGLIRSQGTETVRRRLLEGSDRFSISVIENRARFFSIDTRFKFLAIVCSKALPETRRRKPITLRHERGNASGLEQFGVARIGRDTLAAVRQDMSLPEVRSNDEWRIFRKMVASGVAWDDAAWGWSAQFCREVDMTRERSKFRAKTDGTGLHLVEGRMVQQHRFGAKGHVSGSGRRALWKAFPLGEARVAPQFRISINDVPSVARDRINQVRGGFCDITGQTNERSMMATLIPRGVVCGNKVPTVLFPGDLSEERLLVWCSVMNSIPFDWMLRRIVTTTVNYFLLLSLPMPQLAKDGLPWRRIVSAAQKLRSLDDGGSSDTALLHAGELRAEIDTEVAVAYGLALEDLRIMMADFPLLDRGQPRLEKEQRSTVTKDTLLATVARRMGKDPEPWAARAERAYKLGARAYVPSEFAGVETPAEERSAYAS
jgi:predicted RNA methylase